MSHKRKGQITVSPEWAQHLRPWHRREFWKAERQAQKNMIRTEGATDGESTLKLLAVFTTVATREEARKIASVLVEKQLVACAQVSEIESIYVWKGAVQQEPEFRLLLKTTEPQYSAVEMVIRELHSYELPAIFAVEVGHAFGPYANWVQERSSGESHPSDA